MKTRIVTRTITYQDDKILLVKNKNADFWYPPGGEWNENEILTQCAERELVEELNIKVRVIKFLYLREYYEKETNRRFLETVWLAEPVSDTRFSVNKNDGGQVDQGRWFTKDDLQNIKLYPKELKDRLWDELQDCLSSDNKYLGTSGDNII